MPIAALVEDPPTPTTGWLHSVKTSSLSELFLYCVLFLADETYIRAQSAVTEILGGKYGNSDVKYSLAYNCKKIVPGNQNTEKGHCP